jgi:uncharacterized membrane protein YeiB
MTAEVSVERPKRIAAIDQLRGYAIFGMILVNAKGFFLDGLKEIEWLIPFMTQISHHDRDFFSYANTIAPLFMFVVGMGMRLSYLRRIEKVGIRDIRVSMVKRYGQLVLIAFALYIGWYWDALMSIGLAGLLALFWVDKKWPVRVLVAFVYVAFFQFLILKTSYGGWMFGAVDYGKDAPLLVKLVPMHGDLFDCTLNGGPMGFISWCMMLLFGTVAYDLLATKNTQKIVLGCVTAGVLLCGLGLLARVWGDYGPEWRFTARYMTAPFPLWASGLCFFQLLFFYLVCDKLNLRIPTFASIGMNPLLIYIIQCLVLDVAGGFEPEMSAAMGVVGIILFYTALWGLAYILKRKNIMVKI